MAHPWETLVLGGIDTLKIYRVSPNFVTNKYFTSGITGWADSTPSLSRIIDTDAFGEYMGRIAYTGGLGYAFWRHTQSVNIQNRTFLATWRAKSLGEQKFKAEFASLVTGEVFGTQTFDVDEIPRKYFLVAPTTVSTNTPHSVEIRIYGTEVTGNADLRFDAVYFGEALEEFSFVQPKVVSGESSFMTFEPVGFGRNELWDGEIQEFNKKWRPNYFARWDAMDVTDERFRQRIAVADLLFCIPHIDSDFGFLCRWDGDFQRRYAFGKFLAHKSLIVLKGNELVKEFPIDVVGVTYGMELPPMGV